MFEIPTDFSALSDDELDTALAGAVEAFDGMSQSTSVTNTDLESLRSLATCVDGIRTEQAACRTAAEQAAAEIDTLAAQVRGGDAADTATNDADGATEDTTAAAVEAEGEQDIVEAVTAATVVQRPALDLSNVRRRQPRVLPEPPPQAPASPRPSTSPATRPARSSTSPASPRASSAAPTP